MNLISYITPNNISQEKEKFFSSTTYNPQFEYNWELPKYHEWANKSTKYHKLILALQIQNAPHIVKEASLLFETILDPSILATARSITTNAPQTLPKEPINNIIEAFNKAFSYFGLTGYQVLVSDDMGFNFRPSVKTKTITVSKHARLDFFSIDGEVKHELVHIIRHENGTHNNIPKSKTYLPTEEGLAGYCQDYAGEHGETSLFQHAAEYTATEVALKGSLREVIEYFVSIGFPSELAWQRAIRHKFGFKDTSQPGDIMKPAMYFHHEQKIKQLNSNEIIKLFVGKIELKELKHYPAYSGIVSETNLREFYKF